MSTVQRVNFEPVSSTISAVALRHVALADKTLVNPNSATCAVDGEWFTYNSANKLVRATAIGTPGDPALTLSWPNFAEKGRYDIQAMSEPGLPVIYLGQYEFDTRIFDAAAVVGAGAAITTMLQPVKVATITLGGRNFSGLVGSALNENVPIVGYVTRLPATNGGRLRFLQGWAVRNGTT